MHHPRPRIHFHTLGFSLSICLSEPLSIYLSHSEVLSLRVSISLCVSGGWVCVMEMKRRRRKKEREEGEEGAVCGGRTKRRDKMGRFVVHREGEKRKKEGEGGEVCMGREERKEKKRKRKKKEEKEIRWGHVARCAWLGGDKDIFSN
jgi:hypothetical protein